MNQDRDDLIARVRARRLAKGMELEALPDTESGKRAEALVVNHLEAAIAKQARVAEKDPQL